MAADFIIRHLEDPAKTEVLGRDPKTPEDVFHILHEVFGDCRPLQSLLQAFTTRRQGLGEGILEYSHSLQALAARIGRHQGAPLDAALIRDQFVAGLYPPSLRKDMETFVRGRGGCDFLEVRAEAMRWMRQDDVRDTFQEAVQAVPGEVEELRRQLAAVTTELQELKAQNARTSSVPQCYYCQEMGHVQRFCQKKWADDKRELKSKKRPKSTGPKCFYCQKRGHKVRGCWKKMDAVSSDLCKMTTERDSLREKLKIATETSRSSRDGLQQRIEDLENKLHTVKAESAELRQGVHALKEEVKVQGEHIKDLKLRLRKTSDDAARNKSATTQFKKVSEETKKSLEETQRRLSRCEAELQDQEYPYEQLEMRDREIESLRRQLDSVTQERNEVQEELGNHKTQVQQYIQEVKNSEDMLATKENGSSDQLEQCCKRSVEVGQYRSAFHQLESGSSNLPIDLGTRDLELIPCRGNLEREIKEHLTAQQMFLVTVTIVCTGKTCPAYSLATSLYS